MIRVDSQPLYDALCPEWKLAPVPEPEERLSIVPLSSPVVAPGEPVSFGVSLLRHGKPVSGIGLKCKMEREFHEPVEFPLPTRSYPVEVTTDLERPGFVRLEARYGELSAAGGGAVAPFEIAGLPDVPGFDEFWQRQLALLRSVPMKVLKMEEIAPVLPEYADRVRCFDLRIACAGAKPVSAILAMPRNAAPRSCPGYAFFHGAGVRSAFQPLTWAAHGLIALNVNAHGIENNQPPEYYQELEKGELADYARRPVLEGEASPFRDMFLRVLRALEHYRATGKKLSEQKAESLPPERPYRSLILGLDFPERAVLYRRIDLRVDKMLEAGLIKEAEHVWQNRESFRTAAQAIGYKEFFPYFEQTAPLEACTEKLKQASRNYAKRQLTWFRHMDGVVWLDAGAPDAVQTAIRKTSEFLAKG